MAVSRRRLLMLGGLLAAVLVPVIVQRARSVRLGMPSARKGAAIAVPPALLMRADWMIE